MLSKVLARVFSTLHILLVLNPVIILIPMIRNFKDLVYMRDFV
jgi:hypothetical protein